MRLAGRFLLFSEDKPASKKIFDKFSKRRLLAGSERLCVRLVSGKGETHLIPPRKGGEKMDMIPRNDYGERCQFDAYCKLVLYHEAIDYLREMQRRRDRELSFSDLPQMEMDKLCVVDHYPSDRFTFSSHGYDLHIENELVADAFAGLSVQEQSILILHFVLDLPDQEVGRLVGMSRSAVQRRRAKSLTELRIKLAALMPKGG